MSRREKKNTGFFFADVHSNAQCYVCIRECMKSKTAGAERGGGRKTEGKRKALVDVKNEMTRCECIDGPALLQRAC